MSNQDWEPVVFRSKAKPPPKTKVARFGPSNPNGPKSNYKEDEDGMPVKRTLPTDFGKRMSEARRAKGLTQKQLAQQLNCKPIEIQQYEQNRHPSPNKAFARKIERKLGGGLFK